ncbi:MAG TPA: NAD(P)-dependent oxidoreductase [Steroidobacteraceae bacterium]|nr:NAD(P)-dependent oxidoreductase [Steroidobacteraceae bacterium]
MLLITGATGSIGRKLRHHFAARGVALRLLCLNPRRDPAVVTADLREYDEQWAGELGGVDAVIHLAGDPYAAASWESVQRSNIDLSLNVFRAAREHGVRRIVFASSNWVMAGYRLGSERLTTDLPAWPTNAYGCGKLLCERVGRTLARETGMSFIALRIGCCQHIEGNVPGPQIEHGIWGQQMWLSDRDLCQGVERAAFAEGVQFAVLNLMSDNPGMRWDIEETRRLIGYEPRDGHAAVVTPAIEEQERLLRQEDERSRGFKAGSGKW